MPEAAAAAGAASVPEAAASVPAAVAGRLGGGGTGVTGVGAGGAGGSVTSEIFSGAGLVAGGGGVCPSQATVPTIASRLQRHGKAERAEHRAAPARRRRYPSGDWPCYGALRAAMPTAVTPALRTASITFSRFCSDALAAPAMVTSVFAGSGSAASFAVRSSRLS